MAAQTFAALFLAHVVADYLLQTKWLVINKSRPLALGLHIALVYFAMVAVTFSFSPWFILLALLHLSIDALKTFYMRGGLPGYLADQLLHILSVIAIAVLVPGIWAASPLSEIRLLPMIYLAVGGVIYAVRGGQFAVETVIAPVGSSSDHGVVLGWVERAGLCAVALVGWLPLALIVLGLKLAYVVPVLRARAEAGRRRLVAGTAVSLAWGAGTALPMALLLPFMA